MSSTTPTSTGAPQGYDDPHDVTRLETMSDAVFAFSLTLLVVSSDMPTTYEELMRNAHGFVPFACCFAVLVMIWSMHKKFFRTYMIRDGWTVFLNGLLLFLVLFYVYPLKFLFTSFIASMLGTRGLGWIPIDVREMMEMHQLPGAFIIYGLGFFAIFVTFSFLYLHAWRRRDRLGLDVLARHDAITDVGGHLIMASFGLVSAVVAATTDGLMVVLAGFLYFFIGPARWCHGVARERGRKRLSEAA